MRRSARRIRAWVLRRRVALVVGVVCAAFVCVTVGVLPSTALVGEWIGSAVGERYPCEGGACACSSARACWTGCGCSTLAEKVAWAAREGVAVPAYVDVRGVDLAGLAGGGMGAGCPLCAMKSENRVERPVAFDGGACGGGGGERVVGAGEREGLATLTALGCRGIEMLMALGVVLVVAPDLMRGVGEHVCVGVVGVDPAPVVCARAIDVVTPPPEG